MNFQRNPASPAFREGEEAFQNEICLDACPYEDQTDAWFQWGEGWEQAEFEDSRIPDDDGYNDPRRGQAASLNAGRG